MKQKRIMNLLVICMTFLTLTMTIDNADDNYTNIDGKNESTISVTGNLVPEESEPSEEIKEEEKTPEKTVEPKKEISQVKQEEYLPKTGEYYQSFHFLGILIIGSTLLLFFKRKNQTRN